ncbi:MAG: tetratricopeptide repeat protein [Porphyromonadaceae bacterium]|nr:tetratricopeptide repeat protein [Porphyromonadaceae bacterium]
MKKALILFVLIINGFLLRAQVNTEQLMRVGGNALYFSDYVLAIQYFNQVIKAKPYLEQPYLYRAFAKISLEDYHGALVDLNIAISKNEFIPRAYYARGFVYNRLKRYAEAEQDFSKALEFSPENTTYIIGRLESYDLQKKYNEEIEDINLILRKKGKEPQLVLEKGRIQLLLGDTIAAYNTMDSLTKSNPDMFNAWGGRAMINMMQQHNDSAIADYNKAIELKSDNFTHYINRGNLLHKKQNYSGAIADYNKAIELSPNNEAALFNRSLIAIEVGDYNQAIKDLNKLIKNKPDMYEAVYQRALINQKLGNHTSTISDMSKVIEHYPNFAPAYYARANSYNVLQNKNGAYRDMQAIIRIEEANKKRGNNQSNKTEDEIDTNAKTTQNQSKISDWAKLFEMSETEESTENRFKDNTIRGAIQNRFVEAKPQSDFVLSPYKKDKDVASNNYFFAPLNNLNRELKNELTLYMVNIEVPLTDALINYLFRNIDVVSGKIARDPNDFYSYFVRAIHYSLVQDFDNAIKDFSSAIQLKNDALAYFCRAELRKKQLEVSVANIKTEEDKNKATSLAIDKMLSVDYEMVLRDYDKAIELSAEFVFAHYNRANILIQLKDYNAAIAYYTNAIRINTNFAEAYFNRGLTYIYLGDTDRGIADLSKAGELGIYDAYNLIKKVTN